VSPVQAVRAGAAIRRRSCLATACACAALLSTSPARGDDAPTFADRETDAGDTERAFALMINPLSMTVGVFGAEGDLAIMRHVAVGLESDVYELGNGDVSAAVGIGLLVYPIGSGFRGPYVEPRGVYARPLREPLARFEWGVDSVGFGGVAGWQWSWDYGLSARLGAGMMEFLGGGTAPGATVGSGGITVVMDGSIGWLF
jgi:hypothetical protein